jgi:hypothetical protein
MRIMATVWRGIAWCLTTLSVLALHWPAIARADWRDFLSIDTLCTLVFYVVFFAAIGAASHARARPLVHLLVSVLLLCAAVRLGRSIYGPSRYWRDFSGMTENEVIKSLGPPAFDTRQDLEPMFRPRNAVSLHWGHGWRFRTRVVLSNGVVVAVERWQS